MSIVIGIVLVAMALIPLGFAVYLGVLTFASLRPLPQRRDPAKWPRFAFVVPAHNESGGIAATVKSLDAVEYPSELRQVFVIADNCSDDTAARAREAGARVLERQDKNLRGKGYALAFAFEHLQNLALAERPDHVVVVDADTLISPNLLRAFARAFNDGARAAQADYAVSNPNASWRTRLMRIALAMFHILRSRGREAMSLSCGLRGNGMAFQLALLREVPHTAFSIVEDLEYGIALGRANVRVVYVGDAHVYGEMVAGEKASRSQRQRWEQGRAKIAQQIAVPLLKEAIQKRSVLLFDLACDVWVPPLSQIATLSVSTFAASIGCVMTGWAPAWATIPSSLALVCVFLYVARGWSLSHTGLRGLLDLALAPAYVAWKLLLPVLTRAPKSDEWVRTQRKNEGE